MTHFWPHNTFEKTFFFEIISGKPYFLNFNIILIVSFHHRNNKLRLMRQKETLVSFLELTTMDPTALSLQKFKISIEIYEIKIQNSIYRAEQRRDR